MASSNLPPSLDNDPNVLIITIDPSKIFSNNLPRDERVSIKMSSVHNNKDEVTEFKNFNKCKNCGKRITTTSLVSKIPEKKSKISVMNTIKESEMTFDRGLLGNNSRFELLKDNLINKIENVEGIVINSSTASSATRNLQESTQNKKQSLCIKKLANTNFNCNLLTNSIVGNISRKLNRIPNTFASNHILNFDDVDSQLTKGLSEEKHVSLTISKSCCSPDYNNDASTVKNKSINETESQKTIQQQILCTPIQPPISTDEVPANTNLFNLFSKLPQPIIKNDVSFNSSSCIQNPTSFTSTPIESADEQILIFNQPPTPENFMVSIPSLVIGNEICNAVSNEEPLSNQHSLLPASKKCIKCNNILEKNDDICSTCLKASYLEDVVLISSDDDEEVLLNQIIDLPVIETIKSVELLECYLEKIKRNPNLFESIVFCKEPKEKDYFPFYVCNKIQIGNFNTLPAGVIFISLYGIRMVVINTNFEPITIDLEMDNIVKIFSFHINYHVMIIYVNELAAAGVRFLMNLNGENGYNFDPLSTNEKYRKIVMSFEMHSKQLILMNKFMQKLPSEKYQLLEMDKAEQFMKIMKNCSPEKEFFHSHYYNIKLLEKTFCDYTVLITFDDLISMGREELVNSSIIEFYLGYCYDQLPKDQKSRTYLFGTDFYRLLQSAKKITSPFRKEKILKKIRNYTKNVNIFEKDFIFIPLIDTYWIMCMIGFPYLNGPVDFETDISKNQYEEHKYCKLNSPENLPGYQPDYEAKEKRLDYETDAMNLLESNRRRIKQPCILIFDSLNDGRPHSSVITILRQWLTEEYSAKYNGKKRDFSDRTFKENVVQVPRQLNFFDCGFFLFRYFENFFWRPIVDYTIPISHLKNWFDPYGESPNFCKRKAVLCAILNEHLIQRKHTLPKGVAFPILKFVSEAKSLNSSHRERKYKLSLYYHLSQAGSRLHSVYDVIAMAQ